jgi:pimeloyl-ACP methyl ester carboxylesterase
MDRRKTVSGKIFYISNQQYKDATRCSLEYGLQTVRVYNGKRNHPPNTTPAEQLSFGHRIVHVPKNCSSREIQEMLSGVGLFRRFGASFFGKTPYIERPVPYANMETLFCEIEKDLEESTQHNIVKQFGRKMVILFVSGFDFNHATACMRGFTFNYPYPNAPQIDCPVVSIVWPSENSVFGYNIDGANVEWSVPHTLLIFNAFIERFCAENIIFIDHSMGGRLGARVFEKRFDQNGGNIAESEKLAHVINACADIDAGTYELLYGNAVSACAKKVTNYISDRDWPLYFSRLYWGGYRRLGQSQVDFKYLDPPIIANTDWCNFTVGDVGEMGHSMDGALMLNMLFSNNSDPGPGYVLEEKLTREDGTPRDSSSKHFIVEKERR